SAVLLVAGLAWTVLETAAASEWSCAKPVEIEHGYVEHLVKYHCDPYYELRGTGDGTYKCDENHAWVSLGAGKEAPVCEPGRVAWPGRLVTRHNLTVGATLISEQWLLTTGRNVYLNHSDNAKPEEIAPTLQLFLGGREQPALAIERVVLHPDYPKAVDLALLKLKEKVLLGEEIMPICLPQKDYVQPGRGRNATSWVQPILSNDTFCVGMSELREDTCYGDAGGAFAVQDPDDDTWYAAGILSYDKTCTASKYSVYVDVQHVLAWIKDT
ncbi:PREDICTED: haptoglobin-like, partial [Nestor notabilis]|uniref:haptoglobin-like n=1 Tax=Nestor notabilis TaxID=176057 RepID=UPI0005231AC9